VSQPDKSKLVKLLAPAKTFLISLTLPVRKFFNPSISVKFSKFANSPDKECPAVITSLKIILLISVRCESHGLLKDVPVSTEPPFTTKTPHSYKRQFAPVALPPGRTPLCATGQLHSEQWTHGFQTHVFAGRVLL
jgi:hypothetical protein